MRLAHSTACIRLDDLAADDPAPATEDPAFGRFDNERTVATLLAGLPPAERERLRLRFEVGLSHADIAARLGVSRTCVSRGLRQSLGHLRGRVSVEPR